MNILDAAHATGHDYPGGCTALGPRLGMTGQMLSNKLNPNDKIHKVTLDEAMRMQALTGDHRILLAMAEELGYVAMRMPNCDDFDVGQAAMRAMKEFGQFIGRCEEVLVDGRVTKTELRSVEKELLEAIAHATRLHSLLAAKQNGVR